MEYSYSKDIISSCKDAEEIVRKKLSGVGFGILTEINIKDAFKAKLDLEFKNYKILGACNPGLAHEAIGLENMVGILMPCNILIIDNENGTSKIVFPKASELLKMTENEKLLKLSNKVDELLESAFNNIS